MLLARTLPFAAVYLTKALGTLVVLAVLARLMAPADFAALVHAYGVAVVLSVFVDLGQRHLAFAGLRHAATPAAQRSAATTAWSVRAAGGSVFAVGLGAVALALPGVVPPLLAVGLLLVAATAMVGDVSAAILRGAGRPGPEATALAVEHAGLLAAVGLLGVTGGLTTATALLAIGLAGLGRAVALTVVARRRIPGARAFDAGRLATALPVSLATAAGILVSTAVLRLPLLALPAVMDPQAYAVFAPCFLLFSASFLGLTALIQAGYRSDAPLWQGGFGTARRLLATTLLMGTGLTVAVVAIGEPLTVAYLGEAHRPQAMAAVPAALVVGLSFPVRSLEKILQYQGQAGYVAAVLAVCALTAVAITVAAGLTGPAVLVPYGVALVVSAVLLCRRAVTVAARSG